MHVQAVVDAEDAVGDPSALRIRLVAQDASGAALSDAAVELPDRGDSIPFQQDGRVTVSIHRHRWQQARSDVREVRLRVVWRDGSAGRHKDLTLLAGGG